MTSSSINKPTTEQVESAAKAATPIATGQINLLSKRQVLKRVGVTYQTLWAWMRAGKFPRSRELGGKVAWIEAEIDEWLAALPVRRLKGDAP